jgi:hypothetical protein
MTHSGRRVRPRIVSPGNLHRSGSHGPRGGGTPIGAAIGLLLVQLLAGARPATARERSVSLDSVYRTDPIAIDGAIEDWRDALVYIKQSDMAVAVRNDRDNLYVCLQSRNPGRVLPILDLGLTLWFVGPDGEKGLGIEYPLALDDVEALSRSAHSGGAGPGGAPPGALARLAIKGVPPVDRRIMAVSGSPGISASAVATGDDFVYEIEVPLRRTAEHPYAVDARPGDSIDILLETPEPTPITRQRGQDGSNGGSMAGEAGGGMGGHGGGHQGGQGGGYSGGQAGGYGGYGGGGGGYGGGYGDGQTGSAGGEGRQHHGGQGGGQDSRNRPSTDEGQENNARPPARLNLRLRIRLAAGDTTDRPGTSH